MSAAPLRVLVVDDEPPIRKLLRMGLTAQGYQTLEAPNGKAALELLSQAPDLIILDLGLPDTQGHDLLRTIRARNESVPIVVLSSRGDEAGKVQALDLGADDYITKPFGMDELLAQDAGGVAPPITDHTANVRFSDWRSFRRSRPPDGKGRRQGHQTFTKGV